MIVGETRYVLSTETNVSPPSGLKLMRLSQLQPQNATSHELQPTARGTHKFPRTMQISSLQQMINHEFNADGTKNHVLPNFVIGCRKLGRPKVVSFCACVRSLCSVSSATVHLFLSYLGLRTYLNLP